jgi:hypothetical protein
MDENILSMTVRIDVGSDADAQELDEARRSLRQQLLEIAVQAVESVRTPPPAGTRAVDALAWGSLLVTLAKSPDLLKGAVGIIQSWITVQSADNRTANCRGLTQGRWALGRRAAATHRPFRGKAHPLS